jgi:DNA-binding beta-propeller fold protein YncE
MCVATVALPRCGPVGSLCGDASEFFAVRPGRQAVATIRRSSSGLAEAVRKSSSRGRCGGRLGIALIVAGAAWPGTAGAGSVYVVNNSNPSSVAQYDIGAGGLLSPKTPTTVPAGNNSYDVAISPDGKSAYVTNYDASGSVYQFDIGASGLLSPKAPATVAAASDPVGVAISPDGRSVYVADNGSTQVSQYDVGAGGLLSPKTPAAVATTASNPYQVVVSPDGKSLYVTNNNASGSVSQFDIGTGGLLSAKSPAAVTAGTYPFGMSISPDGKNVYVANYGSPPSVSQYDVGVGGLLNAKTVASVAAGQHPQEVAVSPDGTSLYATNSTGEVAQFDIGAGGLLSPKSPATVTAGTNPYGVAVSPDGRSAYINNYNPSPSGSVSQLDIGAGGLLSAKSPATVPTAPGPFIGVAVTPDRGPTAVFAVAPAAAGSPTALDASASASPDFPIASYRWDFGDGQTQTTSAATVQHVYAQPGSYTVRLSVVDAAGCSQAMIFTGRTASCTGSAKASASQQIIVSAQMIDRISNLAMTPSTIVAAPAGPAVVVAQALSAAPKKRSTGAIVSYADSQPATTTFTVQRPATGRRVGRRCTKPNKKNRGHRRCTRYQDVGSFTHVDAAGPNRFRFTGHLPGGTLRPGKYRLQAVPRNLAGAGPAAIKAFRVRK